MAQYVLEMDHISKSYYGVPVLKDVTIKITPGEIHAIAGENGAGKSTLMNILFGMPVIFDTGGFDGETRIDGNQVKITSPQKAMGLGIGMVHQEFMLLPGFSITENIKLNREITKRNPVSMVFGKSLESLDFGKMNSDARKAVNQLGMSLDETRLVSGLPVGHMQFVEIAREIDKGDIKLLVFDEPTAVLTESEAQMLLKAMKDLTAKGISFLFITHRLDEIMQVADHVTILRDGGMVDQRPKVQITIEEIAAEMVGRKLETSEILKRDHLYDEKDIVLDIRNLKVEMPGEEVRDVSLEVQRGEVLGIGGLAGGGKIGIANGVMGLFPTSGRVMLENKPIELNEPMDPLSKGIAFVSEDRRGTGLLLEQSIEMNITTPTIQVHNRFLKKNFLTPWLHLYDVASIREHSLKYIKELDIRCTGPQQMARRLSGGNQQKVCLARAFSLEPKILFVSEPTRGIDVGAKKIVLDILVELNRNHGVTVIMTSSELGELRKICDRIAIVSEGYLAGILAPDAPDVDYGLMMAGQKTEVV